LPNLQRTPLLLALAGLGLSLAGPVRAAEGSQAWGASSAITAGSPRLAMLTPLPAAPRVFAITPERRALLNTIRYAEGTWKRGSREGYHTLYGGGRFASLACHPERVVVKLYRSAAAGAYQFLPGTWREASQRLQLASFRPENQDQAALYLVDRRGVLEQIDRQGLTRQAMAVLAKEWASFPTLSGQSAYGQPVKQAADLERFYLASLEASRGGERQPA